MVIAKVDQAASLACGAIAAVCPSVDADRANVDAKQSFHASRARRRWTRADRAIGGITIGASFRECSSVRGNKPTCGHAAPKRPDPCIMENA